MFDFEGDVNHFLSNLVREIYIEYWGAPNELCICSFKFKVLKQKFVLRAC